FRLLGLQGYLVTSLIGEPVHVPAEKKQRGIFGKKKSDGDVAPAPSPIPTEAIIPKINTVSLKAEMNALPVEIARKGTGSKDAISNVGNDADKPSGTMLQDLNKVNSWRWTRYSSPRRVTG